VRKKTHESVHLEVAGMSHQARGQQAPVVARAYGPPLSAAVLSREDRTFFLKMLYSRREHLGKGSRMRTGRGEHDTRDTEEGLLSTQMLGGGNTNTPAQSDGASDAAVTHKKNFLFGAPVTKATLLTSGCCLLLTLQNSSYTLLRRYSSGVLHEQASSQSILAVGEIFKGAFCAYMVLAGNGSRCSKQV